MAASSLGSLILTNPLNVFAQAGGEGSAVFRSHDKQSGQMPLARKPDIVASDMKGVADVLLR